ncbi:uncharacterized protein [Pyxicephalus adspersus]|uniref:uncharacterized protein n=1 Tax=Pyxicephalus adspersus TaxID=30357 RepID=UPI003B58EF20
MRSEISKFFPNLRHPILHLCTVSSGDVRRTRKKKGEDVSAWPKAGTGIDAGPDGRNQTDRLLCGFEGPTRYDTSDSEGMDFPRFLPSLITAVFLLSAAPCMTEFDWLVFKVDFTVASGTDLTTATNSLADVMERFLSTNIPGAQFKLVVIRNATNQKP